MPGPGIKWDQVLRKGMKFFVPLWLGVSLLGAGFYYQDLRADRKELTKLQLEHVRLLAKMAALEIRTIISDVLVISTCPELQDLVNHPTPSNRRAVEVAFRDFSRDRGIYDQVRYLDLKGREVVRIDHNRGDPVVVPPALLQDKSRRYYFRDAMTLKRGQVFISPLDLNIEHDRLERPFKPMIRIATPVFDLQGRKRGVVVLNYLAGRLLEALRQASRQIPGHLMLLNPEGFWLIGPSRDEEWGFMVSGRQEMSFARRYRDIWRQMLQRDQGQVHSDHGLFTFATVRPLDARFVSSSHSGQPDAAGRRLIRGEQYFWKMVSFVPARVLWEQAKATMLRWLLPYLAILLLMALASLGLSRAAVQRRRIERELKESEERYRTVVEKSPVGLFIHWDYRIIFANPAACRLMGASSHRELERLSVLEFVHPESKARAKERLERLYRDRVTLPVVVQRFFRLDGREIMVEVASAPIEVGGRPAILSIVVDVTEKKLLEAQLLQAQKMEALGTLAGGIAHDFNNILAAISGYVELALARQKETGGDPYELERILEASGRAKDLIWQILTFSRKVEPAVRPLDLNQEVRRACRIIERTIPKMVTVELCLADDLQTIDADATQVEQVIINLATNAQDAMPQGGRLIIETRNVALDQDFCRRHLGAKPGYYVLLRVSDTGQGMDQKTREHIFDPFFTTKEVGKGTGLGLAMVFGIVKSHGGYITCRSEPGRGTTFDIYLPVREGDASPAFREPPAPPATRGGETILLVDDEGGLREIGSQALSSKGYRVLTAASGEEALQIYRQRGPEIDLVILDLGMPGMGGVRCLQELIELDPEVKVLVASGYSPGDQLKGVADSGIAGYVVKPFRLEELLHAIGRILGEREPSAGSETA